ncbi:MAG: protein kinase [Acidobacteriota bacterium]
MKDDLTKTLKAETSKIRPGQTLANRYRILKELGRGGMGVVYEAEDSKLNRSVALKFLSAGLTQDPEARERFIQEARAASSLDHPNICTIHEIDESEAGEMYISMACYRGESLKEKITRGPLRPAEAIEIALQVAHGLGKAHEHGIIHRDIKPGNIIITAEGTAKILDFGLAKLAGQVRITLPGTTMGTVAYMSPEQVIAETADERTDIWSLGVVLYEMATGELPFRGEKEQAMTYAIVHEQPRSVRDLQPGFPAELEQVIRRALEKGPVKRFASAKEMAASLGDLKLRMEETTFLRAKGLLFRRPRRRLFMVAASLVALGSALLLIWLLTKPSLAFESRDKLMVADVDNLTDDEVFNLALRTAIEADLQQSPYADVFDKPQIRETLRLMRLDPSSRVDEGLGYEVCRFAGVRAFILPRILSVGEAYEIQAILIDPVRRRHVDRLRVTVRGREEVLLTGIDKLAQQLRSRLGESMNSIEKADRAVVEVTTSSWEALDYLSLAQVKWQEGKPKEAATLFELALEKDPRFVDARASLGLVLIQFLGQKKKGQELLTQALEEATKQNLPQRDVLKLRAACRQFVGEDLEGALEEYKTLQELFPDFMPPFNNSGRILMALGRYDEAVIMFEEAIKRAPRNSIPLWNLIFLHLSLRKDPRSAEEASRRMVSLAPNLANSHSFLGWALAIQEKFQEAETECRKSLELEPDHPYALPNLAHILFASGRAAEAVPLYRRVIELVRQGKLHGTVPANSVALALALKQSGQIEEAVKAVAAGREALEKKHESSSVEASDWVYFGLLAAAGGESGKAEGYLQKALAVGIKNADVLMDLAELWALTGKTEQAIETLKKALAAGPSEFFFPVLLPGFHSIRNDPEFRALFKLPGQ